MSREDFDIPEVFRRAMEEAGWNDEGGDEGGGRRPFPQRPDSEKRPNRLLWLVGIGLIIFLSFNWVVTTYTEWLWFSAIGYLSPWLKQWGVRLAVFGIAFLVSLFLFLFNWHRARRNAIKDTPPFNPKFLQIPGINWLITGFSIFLALGFAGSLAAQWAEFLTYIYRVSSGIKDPIFGQDISFYLFELPVYESLQAWILSLLVIIVIGVIAIYAVNRTSEIQRGTWKPHKSDAMRRHVALLGSAILFLWALGYVFAAFNLMYSSRGVVFGASYTDMNASIYALAAQFVLMLVTAVILFINIFRLTLRPLLIAGGLWLAATIILGGIVPSLLQRYSVVPNENVKEAPYIENNIQFTRLAYGLDAIEPQAYDMGEPLTEDQINRNIAILNNIRLWDYRPLLQTYEQLQALRTYYQFNEIDIDRYNIDGIPQQVMLAAREMDKTGLESQTWVNLNLVYTHGYGLVMNPVDEFTTEGQPEFYIQDLPPQSNVPELQVTRPEIYYGELTNDTVFVNSRQEEFDYPQGSDNAYSEYAGTGGVEIDSFLKRLAFAIRSSDFNIILSDDIDNDTRILLHRQIQERIRQITPFLELDGDPYVVLTEDGRLIWIQDAYTLSNRYPYSEPTRLGNGRVINYIRNSVKITVDVYNGTVTYYIADPDDIIAQTYSAIFPGVFKPIEEMPEDLQAHIRYPVDLFTIQTHQYLRYHMTDVRVFYNQEDVWAIPLEVFTTDGATAADSKQPMEPYYVTMPLPGETEPEYLLIQPYTPLGKTNMIAWLAARNDPPNYGELKVYELPKQELIFGPLQIEGRIDQEPTISEQFSLWDQRGSRVIRGNLIVIPMNGSFLYVEPVYLLSQTSALPELKRVIVATDTRIAMGSTLAEAITNLLQEKPGEVTEEILPPEEAAPEDGAGAAPTATPLPIDATMEELIQSANANFEAAQEAQRNGDWAAYGEALEALQRDLEQLAILAGNQ
ncbi:MAG: UPF0182 family protein [Chloroflexi bacterium]|nr:UPF0182 family protein [Chloroflexota bacterium]